MKIEQNYRNERNQRANERATGKKIEFEFNTSERWARTMLKAGAG